MLRAECKERAVLTIFWKLLECSQLPKRHFYFSRIVAAFSMCSHHAQQT